MLGVFGGGVTPLCVLRRQEGYLSEPPFQFLGSSPQFFRSFGLPARPILPLLSAPAPPVLRETPLQKPLSYLRIPGRGLHEPPGEPRLCLPLGGFDGFEQLIEGRFPSLPPGEPVPERPRGDPPHPSRRRPAQAQPERPEYAPLDLRGELRGAPAHGSPTPRSSSSSPPSPPASSSRSPSSPSPSPSGGPSFSCSGEPALPEGSPGTIDGAGP